MKKGIEERGPIAAWLITSRGSMRDPGAARGWTVDRLLKALQTETGWAPVRTTYARWESGAARPEPENIARVEAFYSAHGIAGPNVKPVSEPAPDLATSLLALAHELAETRLERETLKAQVEEMSATLRVLAERVLGEQGNATPAVLDAPGE
jgi:hypothetical protein